MDDQAGVLEQRVKVAALGGTRGLALIGMVGLGAAMIGYFLAPANPFIRLMAFFGGLMMVDPGLYTDMIGFVVLGIIVFIQWNKSKKIAAQAK